MMTADRAMHKAGLGKSDRFYANPILRDEEWNHAKQPSWLLVTVVVTMVGVAFFVGVYGNEPHSTVGWMVGVLAILTYICIGGLRRAWTRRHLRRLHGQVAS